MEKPSGFSLVLFNKTEESSLADKKNLLNIFSPDLFSQIPLKKLLDLSICEFLM
jgi:hypothetical protein